MIFSPFILPLACDRLQLLCYFAFLLLSFHFDSHVPGHCTYTQVQCSVSSVQCQGITSSSCSSMQVRFSLMLFFIFSLCENGYFPVIKHQACMAAVAIHITRCTLADFYLFQEVKCMHIDIWIYYL